MLDCRPSKDVLVRHAIQVSRIEFSSVDVDEIVCHDYVVPSVDPIDPNVVTGAQITILPLSVHAAAQEAI